MLYETFLTSLIGLTWAAYFLRNTLTRHGRNSDMFMRVDGQIDKDLFILFYINGVLFAGFLSCVRSFSASTRLLVVHIVRRLFESSIYTYTWNSTMHISHFITGLVYYPLLLARTLESKHAYPYLFTVGSIVQSILHYYAFEKRKHVRHLHYLIELAIHSSIQLDALNTAWISTLILVNVLNRRR